MGLGLLAVATSALMGAPPAAAAPIFTIQPVTVTEGSGGPLNYFPLTIVRPGGSSLPVRAHVEVFPGTAGVPDDIVPANSRGQRYSGPGFVIPAGAGAFTVPVRTVGIVRDVTREADETFQVQVVLESPRPGGAPAPRSTITIADDDAPPPNRPPAARADVLTISEDTVTVIPVVSNDSDPDGDPLAVIASTTPSHGAVSCGGQTCEYTPSRDYVGYDIFGYTIADGRGGTASSLVFILVTPVNDAPRPVDDVLVVTGSGVWTIDVLANDVDPEGNPMQVRLAAGPAHGSASCSGRTCRYQPAPGYTGPDGFDYRVSDPGGQTAVGHVSVISPSNPVVTLIDASVIEGTEYPTITMQVTPGYTGVGHVAVSASALPGDTASPGDDFGDGALASDFALAFGPFALPLQIAADRLAEPDETYHVQLSAPVGVVFPNGASTTDAVVTIRDDPDADGLLPPAEAARGTDPSDADSDDDGLPDGWEVTADTVSPLRDLTDPRNADTDGDGLSDGLEAGIGAAGPDTAAGFSPDVDSSSTTSPILADTDGDGITDGAEDADGNGRVDAGETDPNDPADPPAPVAR